MTPSFQMNSCINPNVVDGKFLNKNLKMGRFEPYIRYKVEW